MTCYLAARSRQAWTCHCKMLPGIAARRRRKPSPLLCASFAVTGLAVCVVARLTCTDASMLGVLFFSPSDPGLFIRGFQGEITHNIICVYIYICCGVIIWAKFGLMRCYYLGQVCFYKTLFVKKHYKNRGFSTVFWNKLRAQIWGVIIWAKLAIFELQSTWPR